MKLYLIKQNAVTIVLHNSKQYEAQFSDKLYCLNYPEILICYTTRSWYIFTLRIKKMFCSLNAVIMIYGHDGLVWLTLATSAGT